MDKTFLREKPAKLMLNLKNQEVEWHLSRLAKDSGLTYVYLLKLLPKLKSDGLVVEEKKGKKRVVRLTERGMQVASLIDDLNKKITETVKKEEQAATQV